LVHFKRNVLAQVPRGNTEIIAAAVRTVFAQPDAEHVTEQFETIAICSAATAEGGADDARSP
jgi:transposase-like protein